MSNAATTVRNVAAKPAGTNRMPLGDVLFVAIGIPAAALMLAGFVLGLISN